MNAQRKGQWIHNHIRQHKDFPKWEASVTWLENINNQNDFIQQFIFNITDKEFNKFLEDFESYNRNLTQAINRVCDQIKIKMNKALKNISVDALIIKNNIDIELYKDNNMGGYVTLQPDIFEYVKPNKHTLISKTCEEKLEMPSQKQFDEYYAIKAKAEQLDLIIPWLRDNLTGQQQKEIEVISDPLSCRILTYLASDDEKNKTQLIKATADQIIQLDKLTKGIEEKTIQCEKMESLEELSVPSKIKNSKVNVCFCEHKKESHDFYVNSKRCILCNCNEFEFNKETTLTDYNKTSKIITTTINLREYYGTSDDLNCFICWKVFDNEEKALKHVSTHTDQEFLDF